ncbi:MAG: efflux RND transporter periplasmic adaptor subunit [Candidatus Kapaibacteriota bacterium]
MRTIVFLFILSICAGCSKNQSAQNTPKQQYFCPMHPQVQSGKPGVCPICQMDLVLPGHDHEMVDDSNAASLLTLDTRRQVLADVRTVLVAKENVAHSLVATGTLTTPESAQKTIVARVAGRIERLFVRQTGERVREGQALYEVYSPALVQAQSDFLLSLKSIAQAVAQETRQDLPTAQNSASSENMRNFTAKARERLLLLGMSNAQIDALVKSGEAMTRVTVYSPFSGVVVQKNIVEGASVQEGATLFDVADFSTVWNLADVYEQDIQAIRLGQRVTMRLAAYPNELFAGVVRFIYPTLNTETRTVKVRIESANPHGKLRPGMFTETEFAAQSTQQSLTIPEESAIQSGRQTIVWVKESEEGGKGVFRAQAVVLGRRNGGKYEVLSGLREGEAVAASGGFLLDSERQLRGGAVAEAFSPEKTPTMAQSTTKTHNHQFTAVQLPSNLASQFNSLIDAYSALTEALVQDNTGSASQSASTLVQAAEIINTESLGASANMAWQDVRGHLMQEAKALQSASTLNGQRVIFERLSNALFLTLSTFKGAKKLHRAYCPMAFDDKGAYWLTPTTTIRNPYFGAKMLQCGEIRE